MHAPVVAPAAVEPQSIQSAAGPPLKTGARWRAPLIVPRMSRRTELPACTVLCMHAVFFWGGVRGLTPKGWVTRHQMVCMHNIMHAVRDMQACAAGRPRSQYFMPLLKDGLGM